LVGGYYWEECKFPGTEKKGPWGCLGNTVKQMDSNKIPYEVLKDITFA
jgi:hypothetical protein